jgi:AAA domain
VVIFDTAAAIFAAPNENDNHLVTKLLKRTKAALQRHNCAELIMMHTPKMSKADAA